MIISTISLNPAIDKTYFVNAFTPNAVNRAYKVKTNMGGKGTNVSAMAKICGFDSLASGFISGTNGMFIENSLKECGVETDFVHTSGETRVNIKIADEENNIFTDINESGPKVTEEEIDKLYKKAELIACKSDFIHIGGSVPPEIDVDIYKKLIKIGKENGSITILDAEGEVFKKGIEAAPHIIKPNQHELELLIGSKLKSVSEVAAAASELFGQNIETVLVTLGGNGCIAASKNGIYRAYPLNVPVKGTVGAGDSFLMGYLYGLTQGRSFENSVKYAISFASAKVQTEGTDLPTLEQFKEGFNNVIIEKIG